MQCPTDTEVILQLHNYIFSHQGLEKGVEEHPCTDLVSARQHRLYDNFERSLAFAMRNDNLRRILFD